MANIVVTGLQWGDEGKGKIVDLLCPAFDAVVRYQGGNNAGHTVRFGEQNFALHLIPSGILQEGMRCVLGNGMVIAPDAFLEELEGLAATGVDADGRLFVSNRAHVVLPPYLTLDGAREAARGGGRIGTTVRGIGPAYEAKAARFGLRLSDLDAGDLESRLRSLAVRLEREIVALGGGPIGHPAQLADLCRDWRERLEPYLRDTEHLLNRWIRQGKSLLFEGAQGALLDLDHGTYPYVTSSSPTAGGAAAGSGVPPTAFDGALGVLKAYTTRVGAGPFVTELDDDAGDYLRRRGNEFGTTTGRPRRCGWLDLVVARYSSMVSGVRSIALTKLDVLDELDEIRVCEAYRIDGKLVHELPAGLDDLAQAEPVYRTFPGWRDSTVGLLEFGQLPAAARAYLAAVEEGVGVPIGLISTGPRREETVVRPEGGLEALTSGRLADVLARRDG